MTNTTTIDTVIMTINPRLRKATEMRGVVARLDRAVRDVDEHLRVRSEKESTKPWRVWVSWVGGRTDPYAVGGLVPQLQREIRDRLGAEIE